MESRLKYNLVDRLRRQAKEELESTCHTLVFLSIYAKDNAVTYVTFYLLTPTNFPPSLTLCIKLFFLFHCDRDERRHCTFQCNVHQVR